MIKTSNSVVSSAFFFSNIISTLPPFGRSCQRPSSRCRATEDCTIVHWAGTRHFGNPLDTFDAQTVLYHQTADIVTLVGSDNPEFGAASTTGTQSPPATAGPRLEPGTEVVLTFSATNVGPGFLFADGFESGDLSPWN